MCNLYRLYKSADEIHRIFAELGHQLTFPEGIPNFEPRDIRITDRAPIVRATQSSFELIERRWSWPATNGKPVYNFRSEGRNFPNGRCMIVADGFYEHTTPADPKQKRKDRWLFSSATQGLIVIAGIARSTPVGEAFTMLTTSPGPDVAPYHQRQIVLLDPSEWGRWFDPREQSDELLKPAPGGFLTVERA
ncbi:MAG: SOS response-associated peptidase family protein [Sphingomonas sp.]|uniref:SOS response-associated peptidase family protein n=1 Tax=Sphingomonas sp. TaxID=28214 RepID=UPI001834E563|nr:SOS response-associated peptidase family protein [Sphingomonas sp.]MBA3667091.1 SOS response-associated peptidase family protein [Sphingomonas sp.]